MSTDASKDYKAILKKSDEDSSFFFDTPKGLRILLAILRIVMAISFVALFILISSLIESEGKKFVEKTTVKEVLRNAIKNGGELNSVKHIYNTRSIEEVFFWPFSEKRKNYYTDDYPLSGILNDLLVDYLQNTNAKDSLYQRRLCYLIAENEKQNPFDNLEDNQKYSFENIQEKLDSMYTIITPDVLKIAEELNGKNQLVNKYLNKSDISFYISLVALFLTLVLSGYQIYQNYKTNNYFRDIIKQNKNKPEQNEDGKQS